MAMLSDDIGKELCGIFGLPTKDIHKIIITCEAGEAVIVDVEKFATNDEMQRVKGVITEKYKLVLMGD